METYTAYTMTRTYFGEVVRFDAHGTTWLAAKDPDFAHDYYGCGAAVGWSEDYTLPDTAGCCEFCTDTRHAYEVLATVWNHLAEDCDFDTDTDMRAIGRAVRNVANRYGWGVMFVSVSYNGTRAVSWYPDNEGGTWAMVVDMYGAGAAKSYAEMVCAYQNGETWTVGTMPTEQADALEELATPFDCEEPVYGFVWQDVDEEGVSYPTDWELAGCL